ncbi:hypothetical protein TWF696_008491 [Orbilia brochopaga]|uniref:Uncharacterized protein n=1 Tax=Orbilia brochopaga TaxID=3140254 RepID=A0AAV9UKK2_9PEZI
MQQSHYPEIQPTVSLGSQGGAITSRFAEKVRGTQGQATICSFMPSQPKAQAATPTQGGKTVDKDGFETVSRKPRAEPSARAQPLKKGRGKNGRTRRGGARRRQDGSSLNGGGNARPAAKPANEEGEKSTPQPATYVAPRRVPGLTYAAVVGKAAGRASPPPSSLIKGLEAARLPTNLPALTIKSALPSTTTTATVAIPAAGTTAIKKAAAAKKGTSTIDRHRSVAMADTKVPGADLAQTFNRLVTQSQTVMATADIDTVCQAWLHSQQESLAAQMQQQCDDAARAIAAGDILGIPAWALHENEVLVLTTDKIPEILFPITDVVCGRYEEWLEGIGIRAYEVAYDELEFSHRILVFPRRNYDVMRAGDRA